MEKGKKAHRWFWSVYMGLSTSRGTGGLCVSQHERELVREDTREAGKDTAR